MGDYSSSKCKLDLKLFYEGKLIDGQKILNSLSNKLTMTEDVYGRPCRACTDFKQWMKTGPSSGQASSGDSQKKASETQKKSDNKEIINQEYHQCPPDRLELGNKSWSLLHSIAAYFPRKPTESQQSDAKQFMHLFSRLYPCQDCAEDLRQDLITHPPRVTSSEEFSTWMCEMHNRVNVKLGKPEFDCTKVFMRWKDGWDDGSCD